MDPKASSSLSMNVDYVLVLLKAASLLLQHTVYGFCTLHEASFLHLPDGYAREPESAGGGCWQGMCVDGSYSPVGYEAPSRHEVRFQHGSNSCVFFLNEFKENTRVDMSQKNSRSEIDKQYKMCHRCRDHHHVGSHTYSRCHLLGRGERQD